MCYNQSVKYYNLLRYVDAYLVNTDAYIPITCVHTYNRHVDIKADYLGARPFVMRATNLEQMTQPIKSLRSDNIFFIARS